MDLLVKICGVTTAKDAAMAAELGADAIGVNFWPGSKRYVDPAQAGPILAAIPAGVLKVGVFVNATADDVRPPHLRAGARSGAAPRRRGSRRLRDGRSPVHPSGGTGARRGAFAAEVGWKPALWLYDAFVEGFGGGGVPAPWPLVAARAQRPFLLAGGLTAENVADAVRAMRPDGVDVASGVERSAGVKDAAKVAAFIEAARAAI